MMQQDIDFLKNIDREKNVKVYLWVFPPVLIALFMLILILYENQRLTTLSERWDILSSDYVKEVSDNREVFDNQNQAFYETNKNLHLTDIMSYLIIQENDSVVISSVVVEQDASIKVLGTVNNIGNLSLYLRDIGESHWFKNFSDYDLSVVNQLSGDVFQWELQWRR